METRINKKLRQGRHLRDGFCKYAAPTALNRNSFFNHETHETHERNTQSGLG